MGQANTDQLRELDSLPRPDAGAPLPSIVTDDSHLLLAYIVASPKPNWNGVPQGVTTDSADEQIAIVRFQTPRSHSFGAPNDETLHGHRLSQRGLKHYAWFEVLSSSWIQELERMNSVHPRHRPEVFRAYHHYVATFHDSTFECVAHGFDVEILRGSVRSARERMLQLLENGAA